MFFEKLIDIHNATVYCGDIKIFNGFSLGVEQGQSTVILGPNGAGKSTFLKLLSRELYPVASDDSWVKILGQERVVISELRQHIGLVSADLQQTFRPNISGLDVVLSGFFGSIGLFYHQEITEQQSLRAREILIDLGLSDLADRLFAKMSTGQQRRCLLGRAMVCNPDHLILDEPTSGLDIQMTYQYLQVLRKLAQQGKTLLMATHHIHEIPPEIDRVVFIAKGDVVGDGSKKHMLTSDNLSKLFQIPLQVAEKNGFYQVYPG